MKRDGAVIKGHACMHERSETEDGLKSLCAAQEYEELIKYNGCVLKFDNGEGPFFDDLTKQELPTLLVKAARKKELDYFCSKCVWRKVPIAEAHRIAGRPPISVRWVDVIKGDNEEPDIRSRLVARQIRGANEDPMFAPTPPLESLRMILSMATTKLEGG